MMNKLFRKDITPIHLLLFVLLAEVTGLFLLKCFPSVWGQIVAKVVGIPFGPFLSEHPVFYQFVQDVVRGTYVFIVVLSFDFLFTYMVYFVLDRLVTRQGSWKGLLGVSSRAVKGLIKWQLAVGLACVLVCWNVKSFSAVLLIPPFLTFSPLGSLYMALWESSLLLFACSFALTESSRAALKKSVSLITGHWKMWGLFVFVFFWLTFLPSLFTVWLHAPAWICLVGGLGFHALLFVLACIFLFRQDAIFINQ